LFGDSGGGVLDEEEDLGRNGSMRKDAPFSARKRG